jgi:hypothetical protein
VAGFRILAVYQINQTIRADYETNRFHYVKRTEENIFPCRFYQYKTKEARNNYPVELSVKIDSIQPLGQTRQRRR